MSADFQFFNRFLIYLLNTFFDRRITNCADENINNIAVLIYKIRYGSCADIILFYRFTALKAKLFKL